VGVLLRCVRVRWPFLPGIDNCRSPTVEAPVSANWTLIQIPWSAFTPGIGSGGLPVFADGDEITGLTFLAALTFVETSPGTYEPVPSSYQLVLDDIGFF
jgi:hypothetical protein